MNPVLKKYEMDATIEIEYYLIGGFTTANVTLFHENIMTPSSEY